MSDPGVASDYTPLRSNMEFEDLTLPRDKFSSFRYFFVVHPRFTFFLFLDPAVITICSVWLIIRSYDALRIFIAVDLLVSPMIGFIAAMVDESTEIHVTKDTDSSISFLGEVVRLRPGLDVNKWDLIAARSNRVFHQNNNNVTPHFFYDGAKCLSYFKRWYVGPAKSRRANGCDIAHTGLQLIIDQAVKVWRNTGDGIWPR